MAGKQRGEAAVGWGARAAEGDVAARGARLADRNLRQAAAERAEHLQRGPQRGIDLPGLADVETKPHLWHARCRLHRESSLTHLCALCVLCGSIFPGVTVFGFYHRERRGRRE
jgi:hypothetical protein